MFCMECIRKIDAQFMFDNVVELTKNRAQNINLVQERKRVVQVETYNENYNLQKVAELHKKHEDDLQYLQQQTKETIQKINKVNFSNKVFGARLPFRNNIKTIFI